MLKLETTYKEIGFLKHSRFFHCQHPTVTLISNGSVLIQKFHFMISLQLHKKSNPFNVFSCVFSLMESLTKLIFIKFIILSLDLNCIIVLAIPNNFRYFSLDIRSVH